MSWNLSGRRMSMEPFARTGVIVSNQNHIAPFSPSKDVASSTLNPRNDRTCCESDLAAADRPNKEAFLLRDTDVSLTPHSKKNLLVDERTGSAGIVTIVLNEYVSPAS